MLLEMTRAAQAGLRKERQYELITNHLANANTTGYKREILSFDRMMKAKLTTDNSQGDLRQTGNPLDLALGDQGYFRIQTANGIRYTRNGNFMLSRENQIVDSSGNALLSINGPVAVEGDKLTISEDGQVFVDGEAVTRLDIVDFNDPEQLQKEGGSLYRFTGNPIDEIAADNIKVKQGTLEESNIDTVAEMTKMIESHRLYETMQRMMQSFDETDSKVNTMATPIR